jgi:hypothetical protein
MNKQQIKSKLKENSWIFLVIALITIGLSVNMYYPTHTQDTNTTINTNSFHISSYQVDKIDVYKYHLGTLVQHEVTYNVVTATGLNYTMCRVDNMSQGLVTYNANYLGLSNSNTSGTPDGTWAYGNTYGEITTGNLSRVLAVVSYNSNANDSLTYTFSPTASFGNITMAFIFVNSTSFDGDIYGVGTFGSVNLQANTDTLKIVYSRAWTSG